MRDRERSFDVEEHDPSLAPKQQRALHADEVGPELDAAAPDEQPVDAESLWSDDEDPPTGSDSRVDAAAAPNSARREWSGQTTLAAPQNWRERLWSPVFAGGAASACVLAAAGGTAYVLKAVSGWRPVSLTLPQIVSLGGVCLAVLSIAVIAFRAVRSVAHEHRTRHLRARGQLDKVTALDLDRGAGWDDPTLRTDPALTRWLDVVRFRDQRQRALIDRLATLEQEAAQLGSRLLERDRAAVTEAYGQPAVSRIASGVSLLYEELDKQQRDQAVAAARIADMGARLGGVVREARGWQDATQDQLNVHVVSLQRLGEEVQKLAASVEEKLQAMQDEQQRGLPAAKDVVQTLAAGMGDSNAGDLAKTVQSCKDLVARGGSLAIQAALEVTRLGERGEALFPLTEQLKQLVTDCQRLATQLEEASRQHVNLRTAAARGRAMAEEIAAAQGQEISELEAYRRIAARVSEQKLTVVRLGADMNSLAQSFNDQAARLETAAGTLGELTGDASAAEPPLADTEGTRLDGHPFVVENFGDVRFGKEPTPPRTAPTDRLDEPSETMAPAAADEPKRPLEPLFTTPSQRVREDEAERIYDLSELGAVALDEDAPLADAAVDADGEDRIYDLTELGAVALA